MGTLVLGVFIVLAHAGDAKTPAPLTPNRRSRPSTWPRSGTCASSGAGAPGRSRIRRVATRAVLSPIARRRASSQSRTAPDAAATWKDCCPRLSGPTKFRSSRAWN